eukprot:747096-Hanusia_phi.AAC.3
MVDREVLNARDQITAGSSMGAGGPRSERREPCAGRGRGGVGDEGRAGGQERGGGVEAEEERGHGQHKSLHGRRHGYHQSGLTDTRGYSRILDNSPLPLHYGGLCSATPPGQPQRLTSMYNGRDTGIA